MSAADAAVWRVARRDLRATPATTAISVVLVAAIAFLVAAGLGLLGMMVHEAVQGSMDPGSQGGVGVVAMVGLMLLVTTLTPVAVTAMRRRAVELGRLEALGARPRVLLAAALLPTGSVALVGGVLGAALGALAARGVTGPGVPTTWYLGAFVISAVLVIAVCAATAALPALRVTAAAATSRVLPPWLPAALAFGGLALLPVAWWLVGPVERTGPTASVLAGVGVGLVGLAGVASGLVLAIAALPVRRPLALRLALRDAWRHPIKLVPGAVASATLVAVATLGVATTTSYAAAAWQDHRSWGPDWTYLLAGDVDPATLLNAPAGLRTIPVRVLGGGVATGGHTVPLDPQLAGPTMGAAAIASPELLDYWDVPADARAALADGFVVIDEQLADRLGPDAAFPAVGGPVPVRALLPHQFPAPGLVPPEVGGVGAPAFSPVVADAPITQEQIVAMMDPTRDEITFVQAQPFLTDSLRSAIAAAVAGALAAVLISALYAALTRRESSVELRTLEAVGARPGLVRRVGAVTSLLQTVGALAGIPVGIGLAEVFLGTSRWFAVTYSTGARVLPLTLSWPALAALAVALPLSAVVAGLAVRTRPPRA